MSHEPASQVGSETMQPRMSRTDTRSSNSHTTTTTTTTTNQNRLPSKREPGQQAAVTDNYDDGTEFYVIEPAADAASSPAEVDVKDMTQICIVDPTSPFKVGDGNHSNDKRCTFISSNTSTNNNNVNNNNIDVVIDDNNTPTLAAGAVNPASFAGSTASLAALPEHLHSVLRHIRALNPYDLLTITQHAQQRTVRLVYGQLDSSPWYMPSVRMVRADEPYWWNWVVEPDRLSVRMTIAGREVHVHVAWWLFLGTSLVLAWYFLYNVLGSHLMTRGGYLWDPLVTFFVTAVVGGTVCAFFQLPPLMCVLWAGILWTNIGPEVRYLTGGIYKDVTTIVQRLGLVVVLARAGFALSVKGIRPNGLLLGTMPFATEAIVHAFVSNAVFGFESYTWAFLEGCLTSIASPAIIVPEIIKLQNAGIGRESDGPLSLMLSGIGFEICYAVWATSFILDLLFNSSSLAKSIVLGPVQLFGGAVIGVACGWAYVHLLEWLKNAAARANATKEPHPDALDRLFNVAYAMFLMFVGCVMFFGYNHNLAGGAAVMIIAFSAAIANLWAPTAPEKLHFVRALAMTWESFVMPCLFGIVGTTITLTDIFNSTFTPKMIGVFAAATGSRMAMIFAVQFSASYDWKQKLVVCGAYAGKATAQASMGPLALAAVMKLIAAQGGVTDDDTAHKLHNAQIVAHAAQFYIIFSVPLSSLTLSKWGAYILPRSSNPTNV